MGKLTLILAILLNAILAQSQTTVFNVGWHGTPEKIVCAGDTWIVYGHESYGTGKDGKLIKYKRIGNEFQEIASLYVPEDLQDYRFVNGNLRIAAFRAFECNYPPKDLYYYEIDTASFTVINWDRIDRNINLIQAGFATDSTIFSWTDVTYKDSIIYNVNTGIKSVHGLSQLIGHGDTLDFVSSVFNDKFLFVRAAVLASYIVVDVNTDSINLSKAYAAPNGKVRAIYSYSIDSLIVVTDQNIHKLDTNLNSAKSISLPSFLSSKVVNDRLFLINSYWITTYSLPGLQLLSTDSLKGLPVGFTIKDVYPDNNQISVLAGMSGAQGGLYQTVLKQDIMDLSETARHEIALDSAVFVKSGVMNNAQVNTYNVYVSNHGADTIHYFNVQFAHLDLWQCGFYDHSHESLTIAPGETKSFNRQVRIQQAGNVCFYVSASDSRLEDDLSDNSNCTYAWLGNDEFSSLNTISLYPNPTAGNLTIECDLHDFKSFSVCSIDGRQMSVAVLSQNEEALRLDLSSLTNGVYFLKLQIGEKLFRSKLIKE